MKKEKIVLTTVVVLAIVGGTLAFKARGLNTFYLDQNGVCTLRTMLPYGSTTATTIGVGLTTIKASFNSDFANSCPVITVRLIA